jgi:uncharacterized protein YuzE
MASKNLKDLDLKISYDDGVDVLYISFGEPRTGIAVEINDGDFVRVDPYTDKVIGITILNFKERFMPLDTVSLEESARNIIPKVLSEFKN